MEKLTDEQIQFVRMSIGTWLRVRRDDSEPGVPLHCPSEADAHHSALLWRLLSGKAPLPKAPPRSYSSPDYDLGEGKVVTVIDSPSELPQRLPNEFGVVINQHVGYKWADKEKGILVHKNGDYFKYTPNVEKLEGGPIPNRRIAGTIQKVDAPK